MSPRKLPEEALIEAVLRRVQPIRRSKTASLLSLLPPLLMLLDEDEDRNADLQEDKGTASKDLAGAHSQSSATSVRSKGRRTLRHKISDVSNAVTELVAKIDAQDATPDDIKYFCASLEYMLRLIPKERRMSLYGALYSAISRHM